MQTTEIPAPAGLRQRKQARTREALIAAGMQLFLEHGFDAVTVDQIAALVAGGYSGPVSFECYAPEVQGSASIEDDLRRSMEFIASQLRATAA